MALGVNKAIVVGNVGREPDIRETKSGDKIVNISIATSYKPKDGEQVTDWHNVTFFGKLADVAAQYVKKGSKVYVEGQMKTEKWVSKGGENHYTTKVHAKELQLLDRREREGVEPVPADAPDDESAWQEPPVFNE